MEKIQMPEYGHLSEEDWSYLLSLNPHQYVLSIDQSLRTENRFFVDNRFNKLLYFYTATPKAIEEFECIIPGNKVLFRARIYDKPNAKEKAKNAIDGEFNGYGKDGSFVPPSDKHCSQGRINPDGIRYLYLASTADCAVQEVTPVLKSWVSVAKIKFLETARVFNMAKTISFGILDDDMKSSWVMEVMSCINSLFSKPYGRDGDYLICQYVSEFIKNVGYDGIRFFSSRVMQKYCDESYVNYTIFNYNICEPISSDLLYVFDSHLETKSYMQLEAVTYHGEVE